MIILLEIGGGVALLLVGGNLLVRGSVDLARRLGVSPLVIGLTVIAFGTSAPELLVSLIAALEGAPGVAVGNVVGGNIANILLILGVAGLIYPVGWKPRSLYRYGLVTIFATVLFVVLCMTGRIESWHGALLLMCLGGYLAYTYSGERGTRETAQAYEREVAEIGQDHDPLTQALMRLGLGFAGVILGAELLVDGAVVLARVAGVSEAVIGLTLVAVGTSVPELVTSAVAAFRRHTELALGNVLGSNVFNMLGVMGAVSVVTPVAVPDEMRRFDLWVMMAVILAFVPLGIRARRIGRPLALAFLALYAAYVAAQFVGFSSIVPTPA